MWERFRKWLKALFEKDELDKLPPQVDSKVPQTSPPFPIIDANMDAWFKDYGFPSSPMPEIAKELREHALELGWWSAKPTPPPSPNPPHPTGDWNPFENI